MTVSHGPDEPLLGRPSSTARCIACVPPLLTTGTGDGLPVFAVTSEPVQRISLKSTWMGMAWSRDGATLYVSSGNANSSEGTEPPSRAPIYKFSYANGRLSEHPTGQLDETIPLDKIYWSGVALHPRKNLLYAANRGTADAPSNVVVFDPKPER